MYLLFVLCACIATNMVGGFTDSIYERLILGSDMLMEVKKACEQKADFDPLYEKVLEQPLPMPLRLFETVFSESKEARLAALWQSAGEYLQEVLYAPIFFRVGAFAVWNDADVQTRLHSLYGDDANLFNTIMFALDGLHQKIDEKVKAPRSWWPSHRYHVFKNSDSELRAILKEILDNLVHARLLINQMSPDLAASPFALFVPRLLESLEFLGNNYKRLERVNLSSIKQRYYAWRTQLLTNAIKRCVPPLIPMSGNY